MKKYLICLVVSLAILIPTATHADDSTQTLLNLWKVVSGYLTPRTATNGLQIPSLASSNLCLKTDASGKFSTTACGTGASGTTTWGSILGTLSDQTDLQGALDAKLSTTTAASTYYLQSNPASYITAASLVPYLTTTTAASTYYLQSNPASYITSSALTPYLTTTTAASTYQPIGSYLTGTKVDSFNTRTGAVTLSSSDVTTALTFTPYNATNPSNYIAAAGVPAAETDSAHDTCAEITGCVQNAITASALTPYLTTTTAASTYYLQTNPASYITASALTPYLTTTTAASTYVARNDWTTIDSYPSACSAGNYVSGLGDTLTCTALPAGSGATTTITSNILSSGPAFTFATSSATGLNFNITGSGATLTFSPQLQANYNIPLSASTTNWNTAYGWGNHASAGYLTSYTETDPVVKALTGIIVSNGSTISAITNNSAIWDKALQWDGGSTSLVAATGRTSLGLTDTATLASSTWLKVANNLSDLNNTGTARTNLGLGGLAVLNVPSAGIVTSNGSALSNITDSSANWNTAYTDRLKWDGGSTDLVAATGRTSLGLGTMALEPNTGSTTITTLGTIATGIWNGTDIAVADGGTGAGTLTDHGVLIGSGTGAITPLAVGTNGQLLIGSSAADPVFATLNCNSNLTCTVGAGTLEINLDSELSVTTSTVTTVLIIPNGTAPVANDPGELAHDTTDNQLILDDYVIAKATQKIWSITVASTSPAFIAAGLLPVPTQLDGYTITAIRCYVPNAGTAKTVAVEDNDTNSSEDVVCGPTVTSDDGSIANPTYTGGEISKIDFGTSSGTPDYVSVSVFGTWTRE